MADQIIQTLGFDASGAIKEISTLVAALSNLERALRGVAQSSSAFNKANVGKNLKTLNSALKQTGTTAQQTGKQVATSFNGAAQAIKNAQAPTKNLTVSWQTLGRVIAVQTILRAWNQVSSAIVNATKESIQFQLRIAEIATIARGRLGDLAEITQGVQLTAEQFGFDVLDVAEAKYQELSNQVKGSTDSLEFQTAAAQLARVTNSQLSDSVSALSSVLNAFGEDAAKSEEIAALLFNTVEQGRTRLPELANSLGRVASIANAVGVESNELLAALARLTQQGVKTDKAITQILGVLNKLLQPTEELTKAFRDIGVEDAEEGFRRFGGFLPFLQRLLQETGGDAKEFGDQFNNVRAIAGVLGLVGGDAEKTNDIFTELNGTITESTSRFQEMFDLVDGTDAVAFQKEWEKFRIELLNIGSQVLPLVTKSLEFLNNTIDRIRDNWLLFTSLLTGGAGIMAAFAAQSVVATASVGGLAAAFVALTGPVGLAVAAFAALAAVSVSVINAVNNVNAETFEFLSFEFTQVLAKKRKALDQLSTSYDNVGDAIDGSISRSQQFLNTFRDIERVAEETVGNLDRIFTAGLSGGLAQILADRKSIVSALRESVQGLEKDLTDSVAREASIRNDIENQALESRISGLDKRRQALFRLFDAQKAIQRAEQATREATTTEEIKEVEQIWENVFQKLQKVGTAAKASNDIGLVRRYNQLVQQGQNGRLEREKAFQALRKQEAAAAAASLAEEQAELEQISRLIKEINTTASVVDKEGRLLPPEELKKRGVELERLLNQLRELALTPGQLDLAEIFGVEEFAARFDEQLKNLAIQAPIDRQALLTDAVDAFSELRSKIPKDLLTLGINLEIIDQGTLGTDPLAALSDALEEAKTQLGPLRQELKDIAVEENNVEANAAAFRQIFSRMTGDTAIVNKVGDTLAQLAENTEVSEETVKRLQVALENLFVSGDIANALDFAPGNDIKAIEKLFEQLTRLRKAQAGLSQAREGFTLFDQNAFDNLNQFIGAFQRWRVSAEQGIDLSSVVTDSGSIAANWGAGTSAVEATNKALGQQIVQVDGLISKQQILNQLRSEGGQARQFGGPISRAFGGPISYFSKGGMAGRGTDTIPAMLSPGEFVMNARSSRMFAAELQAMNAGVKPAYRAEGGPVNNTSINVGDINVQGASNPDVTARRVISTMKREFRRGTSSRF